MIKHLQIVPNAGLYHELVCSALQGIAANPTLCDVSTRERAQIALDMATHALDGVIAVDGGERDFKREKKKPQKPTGRHSSPDHQAPGRPVILDAIRQHLDNFFQSWSTDEVLSLRAAARKLVAFASVHGFEMSERTAADAIKQLGAEAKLIIKESEDGAFSVTI